MTIGWFSLVIAATCCLRPRASRVQPAGVARHGALRRGEPVGWGDLAEVAKKSTEPAPAPSPAYASLGEEGHHEGDAHGEHGGHGDHHVAKHDAHHVAEHGGHGDDADPGGDAVHGHADSAHGAEHGEADHAADDHGHHEADHEAHPEHSEAHGHDHVGADSHGHSHDEADHGAHHEHAEADGHGHLEEDHGAHHSHDDHGSHGEHLDDHHGVEGPHEDEHGHDHGHGHERPRGASSVAIGLIATTVMIPLVVSMALEPGVMGTLTMKMLDTFVSIFLAVLWFSAFDQAVKTFRVATWFPFAAEIVCLLQVVVLYCLAIWIAWTWRDKQMALTTLTVCGAHYIAFAGIGAGSGAQEAAGELAGKDLSISMSFVFVALAFGFICALYFANWILFRSDRPEEKRFHRSVNEMEIDIAGLVISFLITQAVRQAITGHYPAVHFFLQLVGWTSSPHVKTTALQRSFMLLWSVGLTIFAAFAAPVIDQYAILRGTHWARMGSRFLKVVIIMMVAWGYLLWGTWEFYDSFDGDPMFAHMVFACICTFVALLVLFLMATFQERFSSNAARETNAITVSGISLVAAWSWEHCFVFAFDVIGDRYEVGYEGLVPKLVMATVIPLILMPTYVKHVRTHVLKHEEEEEREEEEREYRILSEHKASNSPNKGEEDEDEEDKVDPSAPAWKSTPNLKLH